MPDDGILKAEQRVREMNRMTQQYSEQGNRYMQNMQNIQNMRRRNTNTPQSRPAADPATRFEPVSLPQENQGQAGNPPQNGSTRNGSYNSHNSRQNGNPIRGGVNYQSFPNGRNDTQNGSNRNMQSSVNQRNSRQPQNTPLPPPVPEPEPEYEPPQEQERTVPAQPRQENGSFSVPDIFSGLGADSEQLLLLALIYLLIREKADIKLILALCYLIL